MVGLIGDEYLKDDEYLSAEERWVRHRLDSAIGPTCVTDMSERGGPERKHDLEAVLPDGRIAAIEITREADPARLSVTDATRHHLSNVKVPGSQFWWLVQLTPQADARALSKPAGLVALLADMEEQGESSVTTLSDYRNPWRCRLKELGIQSVHGIAGSDRRETVTVWSEMVGGFGWVRLTADNWITDFLTKAGRRKLEKLARADASERHLVIVLDPDTKAGMGISLALSDMPEGAASDDLPSVVPPGR